MVFNVSVINMATCVYLLSSSLRQQQQQKKVLVAVEIGQKLPLMSLLFQKNFQKKVVSETVTVRFRGRVQWVNAVWRPESTEGTCSSASLQQLTALCVSRCACARVCIVLNMSWVRFSISPFQIEVSWREWENQRWGKQEENICLLIGLLSEPG